MNGSFGFGLLGWARKVLLVKIGRARLSLGGDEKGDGGSYYEKNKEHILAKQKEYRSKHKERLKELNRLYVAKNAEAIKEQKREYRAKHKLKRRETLKGGNAEGRKLLMKSYYLNNKEKRLQSQREYYRKNKELINKKRKESALRNTFMKNYYRNNKELIKIKKQAYHRRYKHLINQKKRDYYNKNRETIKLKKRLSYLTHLKPRRKNKIWTNPEHVRLFFESVKCELHIREPVDWYRISHSQMNQVGGASLYNSLGSLGKAIQYAYPEIEWDLSKFSFRGKKSTQRWLKVILEQILPQNTDILEDFLHPDLVWGETNHKMELDIWVPKYTLALEYQGEHHYHDFHTAYGPTGTSALYTERDLKKKQNCLERGITLAIIPYWWDRKKDSLAATLYQLRPDVFTETESPGIPATPPNAPLKEDTQLMGHKITTFFMHGHEWNGEQDPTGWIISEKLDGLRAFWDGKRLFSKRGQPILAPVDFTGPLPSGTCLDGELWIDYGCFNTISSMYRKSHLANNADLWRDVKYCVFDAPKHPGNYLERHTFARDVISGCGPNISIVPVETCLGFKHLQTVLEEVTTRKGEGLMLYHPEAKYTSGRTHHLLKVKAYTEEDVKFLECNTNSYSFLCEQKNGVTCIVKCSGWDYMFPPSAGTVLSVKHSGYSTSHKMKYPFLLRVRPDLSWDQIKHLQQHTM